MIHSSMQRRLTDDPRQLRTLVARASGVAQDHQLTSVMIGLTAPVGDPLFPDFVDFLQSALRIEGGIFRMTRERAVIYLADVDSAQAEKVLERLIADFTAQYPSFSGSVPQSRCFEVKPGEQAQVKDVLKEVFAPPVYH